MAESLRGKDTLIQDDSSESRALVPVNSIPEVRNINKLPPQLLSRILAYLPQEELVINRGVCRYWRDIIDEHCPMKSVLFYGCDEFNERKMQLRMKKCAFVFWELDDINFWFKNPQCIRTIRINGHISDEICSRLLNQLRPYIETLEISSQTLCNIFPLRCVFPNLQKKKIYNSLIPLRYPLTLTLDRPFLYQVPLLTHLKLSLRYRCNEWPLIDGIYENLFNFLGKQGQSMTHLELDLGVYNIIKSQGVGQVEPQEPFDLPNVLKRKLFNGKLQFLHLDLNLEPRYISIWAPIIQRQKNLVEVSLNLGVFDEEGGVAVSNILPGILSSISTLESIRLKNIPSVSSEQNSWIPFDCSVLKNAVNLRRLEVEGNFFDENVRSDIINLGHIPLGSLKELKICDFVCDSGELQTLVDTSQMLESLFLDRTIAPLNWPAVLSTGVHGGIILSFMEKPNKRRIRISNCINYYNAAENDKFAMLNLSYPDSWEQDGENHLWSWSGDF